MMVTSIMMATSTEPNSNWAGEWRCRADGPWAGLSAAAGDLNTA